MLERRLALKKAREDFNTMLEDCAELSAGMRLSKAAQILEDDPRWKVWPGFPYLLRTELHHQSACTSIESKISYIYAARLLLGMPLPTAAQEV